jgi:tetrahydromethanopterin S-methyltransferase subunit E
MKRSSTALAVLGVLAFLAGLTFTLQGLGYLGPTSGLMFDNPAWVTQGSLILVLGIVLISVALLLNRRGATAAPKPQA